MQFKTRPEDFIVQELARLPLSPEGDFAIYRVEKEEVTTLKVQIHIAAQLGRRNADVQAPALKDKHATATQYLAVRGTGPAELSGPGYHAQFVGRSRRPLRPGDLMGNRFTVTLRDLAPEQMEDVREQLNQMERYGLPNYYDEQRFGSYIGNPSAPDRFMGKTILRRDAEGAVRAYLGYSFRNDPRRVRKFKRVARQNWCEWAYLLDVAPRPSNYRSVLTYLKDHPEGYRKALNLIPRRLLSLFLVAYQSYLWNKIAGAYLDTLREDGADLPRLEMLDLSLPWYHELAEAQHATLSATEVALPGHRAVYRDAQLWQVVKNVLVEEGLRLNDLKARILKRAYLPKGSRSLLLHPADVSLQAAQPDELFPGRYAARLSFSLPRGTYATLVLKRLGAES